MGSRPFAVALGAASCALYWLLLRRPMLTWGATEEEEEASRLPGDELVGNADRVATTELRLRPLADASLRTAAAVFVLAGAIVGLSHPVAIVLVAVGSVLLIPEQRLKHWLRRPAH